MASQQFLEKLKQQAEVNKLVKQLEALLEDPNNSEAANELINKINKLKGGKNEN
jgi:hypothetical protein